MARIRTIKPDFWTDETLTECSLSARLLFIGSWNFADDNGNLEHSAKQLKMKIFPADDIKVTPLLNELVAHGLLIEYSVSDKKYLHIRGFLKHQVINRPSKSNIPPFDDSLRTHGTLPEDSLREGKGREVEGKGRELNTIAPTPGNGSGSKPKGWANLISWNKEKGCFEGIAPEMFEKWEKAYPAVDLNSQLNRADEWLKANPTKQKSNYYRFIVNWLSRAQERGGR